MENLQLYIDYIGRTNLFNFIIFASIIVFLIKKIDIASLLEKNQNSIKDDILNSESTKLNSEEKFNEARGALDNIQSEIDLIFNSSKENANIVGEKYLKNGENTKATIEENTAKSIDNNKLILKNDILKKVSLASIEIAKDYIKNELENNQELHDKLINESIESIEGVNL